jgi:hypothetical protein
MNNLQEIESAIGQLSTEDLAAFRAWFAEFDAKAWDRQFEEDVAVERLNKIANNRGIDRFYEEYDRTEPTTAEITALALQGGSFDFLDSEPDLYDSEDGEAI